MLHSHLLLVGCITWDAVCNYFGQLLLPGNLPNVGLLLVGTVGTFLALRNLNTLSQQTKANELAAKAALQNTEALIDAERPWIVVRPVANSSMGPTLIKFAAINVGKTPASVKSIWSTDIYTPREHELKLTPDSETAESLLVSPPCFLPATDSTQVRMINVSELGRRYLLGGGIGDLHVYVRIIYFDASDAAQQRPRETRCLFTVRPGDINMAVPDPRYPQHNFYR